MAAIETLEPRATAARRRIVHETEGGVSGALVGSIVGAAAGPPGIVAGAIMGGVAGALSALALENWNETMAERTRELDEEIGVIGGELGAPNLEHPPATVGAYSAASMGAVGSSDHAPAEGPIEPPES